MVFTRSAARHKCWATLPINRRTTTASHICGTSAPSWMSRPEKSSPCWGASRIWQRFPAGHPLRNDVGAGQGRKPMIQVNYGSATTHGKRAGYFGRILRVLVAAMFIGAGLLGASAGARPGHAASSVILRVWYGTDDPTEGPLAQSLAASFQSSHSGVRVQLTTYSLDDIN